MALNVGAVSHVLYLLYLRPLRTRGNIHPSKGYQTRHVEDDRLKFRVIYLETSVHDWVGFLAYYFTIDCYQLL